MDFKFLRLRRMKRKIVSFLCKPHVPIQIRGGKCRIGSDYGCFFVMTDHMPSKPIIYSFGVGEDISFDLEMIRRYSAEVYGFDPTPKSVKWMETQNVPAQYHFYPVGLSDKDGEEEFYLPVNPGHVSASVISHEGVDKHNLVKVPMKTLKTIMKELGHDHIDILKMDIEGSEFKAMDGILELGPVFEQLCVEIHYHYFDDAENKLRGFISKMNEYGYYLSAKTENMEAFTFARK